MQGPDGSVSGHLDALCAGSAMLGLGLGARRGEGLGTDATRLMLDWAFNVLGLSCVSLETLPSNTAAIRAYERAGFNRVGTHNGSVLRLARSTSATRNAAIAELTRSGDPLIDNGAGRSGSASRPASIAYGSGHVVRSEAKVRSYGRPGPAKA